jgi:hypothetical protein
MIIKKDSWHYRLLDLFGDVPWELKNYGSFGLCPYCRCVLFALFQSLVICLITLSLLSFVVSYIAFCFGYPISKEPVLLAGAGVIVIAFSAFIGINICWGDLIKEKEDDFFQLFSIKEFYERKPKEPSLIREWFKAIHDKVCPSITLEE